MSFKRKFKRAVKNILGDFSGITWKDLDHKKVYLAILAFVLVIALVVLLIVAIVSGVKKASGSDGENHDFHVEESEVPEEAEEGNPLEVDAYAGVNELVAKYFEGRAAGDIEMIEETVDVLTDEEKATIDKKKNYIEAYNNIVCYTKKGPEENSYIVFASYEMKFYDLETPAPGIQALYVCTGENGSLYISNGEASEELANYVLELAAEEEVAAVISDVDARYKQLVAEDEELGKFAQTFLEAQQQGEEAEEDSTEPEEPAEPAENDTKELEEPVKTTVNDGIRIRKERSTESEVLATLVSGTEILVYASYEDGWSKIEFDGDQGYCKTEFLTSTEGVPMLNTEEADSEVDDEENTSDESSAAEVNKQMQFKETVRIRKEPTTESERIANGYESELVKVIENYSDGWSKIEYNGMTGYCKTEFLTEAN